MALQGSDTKTPSSAEKGIQINDPVRGARGATAHRVVALLSVAVACPEAGKFFVRRELPLSLLWFDGTSFAEVDA